jgi:hypothetical protein
MHRSQKGSLRVLACAVSLALTSSALAAAFTPGDIVVTRAVGGAVDTTGGGGSVGAVITPGVLTGSGTAASVFIDEYTPAGVFVQSIQLPNVRRTTGTGNAALTFSGTQNNEGAITLSLDKRYFVVGGYNATGAVSTASPDYLNTNGGASTTVERVAGLIDMNGVVNTTTALQDVGSAQPMRSAYSTNGTDIWIGGTSGGNVTIGGNSVATGGVHYTTVGSSTSTQLTQGNTNQRILNGFFNQLYISNNSSSATLRGVNTVGSGFPTSGGPSLPITQLPGFNNTNTPTPASEVADDYWFKDASTLYIADQRTNGVDGGVQKWLFEDTNADTIPDAWVFKYVVTLGAQAGPTTGGNDGGHGLAGTIDSISGDAILYVTTFDGTGANRNKLIRLDDTGTQAGMAASALTLATAPDNGGFATAFRGVEIVPPVPEPTSLALLLAAGTLIKRRRG